jgi:outer membrane biosynthesis protein TonB
MENLLETALTLIKQYALIFYGLGLLGLLFYLNRARSAYRQMRLTPFPIEREEASANVRDALLITTIFVAIVGATFYIERILLAPPGDTAGENGIVLNEDGVAIPDSETGEEDGEVVLTVTATSPAIGPTPEQSPTPTSPPVEPTPAGESAPPPTSPPAADAPTPEPSPTPEPTIEPTATMVVEETATPVPSPIPTQPPLPTSPPAPVVPAASCPTTGVQIASPGNGAVVSGSVTINGTADIPNFQFYKVEYSAGTSQSSFSSIGDIVAAPVRGGRLATWNTSGFGAGTYAIRLTVVDATGNFPAPCTIFVVVQ